MKQMPFQLYYKQLPSIYLYEYINMLSCPEKHSMTYESDSEIV